MESVQFVVSGPADQAFANYAKSVEHREMTRRIMASVAAPPTVPSGPAHYSVREAYRCPAADRLVSGRR